MIAALAIRRNAFLQSARALRSATIYPVALSLRPQCLRSRLPPLRPLQTTALRQASEKSTPFFCPEHLTIYVAPRAQIGLAVFRLGTLVLFGISAFVITPIWYHDPNTPAWVVPFPAIAGSLPLLATLAWGPMVSNIVVVLPPSARRSKEALLRFASDAPPNTLLQLRFIRFAPWFSKRTVFYRDLRRLPLSKSRLSNLEHISWRNERMVQEAIGSGEERALKRSEKLVRMFMGRFWVGQATIAGHNTRVPGVWERMWVRIPEKAAEIEKGVVVGTVGQEAGKKQLAAGAGPAPPPAPPAGAQRRGSRPTIPPAAPKRRVRG